MRRRRGVWLIGGIVLLTLLAGGGWATWAYLQPKPAVPNWGAEYDLTARPPDRLAPGTVIGDTPPAGWSHLVIKSLPRVRPDFKPRLLELVVRHAAWMFTAFTADVCAEEGLTPTRYRFRAVGLGLGTRVNGQDTVITPETASRYGVDLGLFTRQILERGYKVQDQAMLVLSGRTMGLLDTPVWVHIDGRNTPVRFRYALLVDPPTGRLDVVAWRLDAADEVGGGTAVLLNPNTVDEIELIPDMSKFLPGGFPDPDAGEALFGVDDLPPGRARFTLSPELRRLAGHTRFTADDAHALEAGLRELIAGR